MVCYLVISRMGLRNGRMMSNGGWEVIHAHRRSLVVRDFGQNRQRYIAERRLNIF